MHSGSVYRRYKKARRRFSLTTYVLLFVWLVLALAQWLVVVLVQDIREMILDNYIISMVTFAAAICIFALFLFCEVLRYSNIVSFVISLVIVELQIIALFTLVAHTYWLEMFMYFLICAVVVIIFVILGLILPRQMDLTLHIALLFILAFLFLLITVFFLMHRLLVSQMFQDIKHDGFLLVQLPISITILLFVIYHAQTISGGRFAEMRLHDFCLGSLILFHDFLIIYWLTFYWQLRMGVVTPEDWTHVSNFSQEEGRRIHLVEYDDYYTDSIYSNNTSSEKIENISQPTLEEPKQAITLDFRREDVERSSKTRYHRSWRFNQLSRDKLRKFINIDVQTTERQRSYNVEEAEFDYK